MILYRVFPWDKGAAPTEPGGALFVSSSNVGRVSNPSLYSELYAVEQPECAIAEGFGRLEEWRPEDFVHALGNPYALASYDLADATPIFDLDDIASLKRIAIAKPSDVVSRNRDVTQRWARSIFALQSYHGCKWWSYYYPSWVVFALWDLSGLSVRPDHVVLNLDHPAVVNAATTIVRQRIHR